MLKNIQENIAKNGPPIKIRTTECPLFRVFLHFILLHINTIVDGVVIYQEIDLPVYFWFKNVSINDILNNSDIIIFK